MSTVLWLRLSPSLPRQKMDNYNPTNYDLGSIYVDPSDHLSIQPALCPCLCLCSSASLCLCLPLCPRPSASVCRFILLSLCLSRSSRVSVRLPLLLFVNCCERCYIRNERCYNCCSCSNCGNIHFCVAALAALVAAFIFYVAALAAAKFKSLYNLNSKCC